MSHGPVQKKLLRVPEAMEALGVSRTTLNKLMRCNAICRVHIDRGVRITSASIDKFIAQLEAETEAEFAQ